MQKRKFDELISHFNRKVSDMGIDQKYKMELLGMISAIGFAHEKELSTNLAEVGTDAISRADAIKIVQNRCKRLTTGCVLAVTEIRNLPPAEPKRGKWIEDKGQQTLMQNFIEKGEVWRVCSVCGAGHMIGHKYECDKAYHETHHNFCPNCGADMREGSENE